MFLYEDMNGEQTLMVLLAGCEFALTGRQVRFKKKRADFLGGWRALICVGMFEHLFQLHRCQELRAANQSDSWMSLRLWAFSFLLMGMFRARSCRCFFGWLPCNRKPVSQRGTWSVSPPQIMVCDLGMI